MGSLGPSSACWNDEDDYKLRKAVEAGASLESLAKGAIEFSQRFTLQEIQERWYSLLYDPVVSTEAAKSMYEYERSGSNRYENANSRKRESVHSLFHAMYKRICTEHNAYGDLSFLLSDDDTDTNLLRNEDHVPNNYGFELPNMPFDIFNNDNNGIGADQNCMPVDDNITEFGGPQIFDSLNSDFNATLNNLGYSSALPEMPFWSKNEDTTMGDEYYHLDTADVKNTSELVYLEKLSDSMLNFTNDDETSILTNVEGTDADMNKDHIPMVEHEIAQDPVIEQPVKLACVDYLIYRDGVIFCPLNTEDTNIPSNDHLIFHEDGTISSVDDNLENEDSIQAELDKHLFNMVDSPREDPLNNSDRCKVLPWPNNAENPSTSDHELSFENDDFVPSFSQIETMLLEMDLDPEDQDNPISEQLAKYQTDDAKRKMIKLEQSFNASLQREMIYHGALAVLYGEYFEHYIKKTKVLLGRTTADNFVDIDLGRGGSSNKVSRQQGILKMDENGIFVLKNISKISIFVNDKKVETGQSIALQSGCLLEIRDMAFIFEINQTCVKQYLSKKTDKSVSAKIVSSSDNQA